MGRQICGSDSESSGDLMLFKETKLKGAYIIEIEPAQDNRGFFARSFCRNEFKRRGLNPDIAQCSISFNRKKGTLRGMHYQIFEYAEDKVVMCVKGAIYDVIIDLRRDSVTRGKWFSVELKADNYKMIYVPKGFAHGFQALKSDTVVLYQISEFYALESSGGIKWDDPFFKIKWPIEKTIISEKDKNYPLFKGKWLKF